MNLRYRPSPTLHLAACQSYSRLAAGRYVGTWDRPPLPARAQARARRRGDYVQCRYTYGRYHVLVGRLGSFGPCPRSNPQRGRDKRDPRINKTQENHPTFLCYCFVVVSKTSQAPPQTTPLPRIAATRKKPKDHQLPPPFRPPCLPSSTCGLRRSRSSGARLVRSPLPPPSCAPTHDAKSRSLSPSNPSPSSALPPHFPEGKGFRREEEG